VYKVNSFVDPPLFKLVIYPPTLQSLPSNYVYGLIFYIVPILHLLTIPF